MTRSIRIPLLALTVCVASPAFAGGSMLPVVYKGGGGKSTGGGMAIYKGASQYKPNFTMPGKNTPHVEDIDHEVVSSTLNGSHANAQPGQPAQQRRGAFKGIGAWLKKNFKVNTRSQLDEVKNLRGAGELKAAADKLIEIKSQPRGLFDRIAFMGTRNKLAKAARQSLKANTEDGKFDKAGDALQGLNTMRDGGALSLFGRFRSWNAKRVATGNTKDVLDEASPRKAKNLDQANAALAVAGLDFLANLKNKGTESRTYRKAEKRTVSRLMKTAKNFGKYGKMDKVEGTLDAMKDLDSYDPQAGEKTYQTAAKIAIKLHNANARAYFRKGHLDSAADEILEAMKVEGRRGGDPATMYPRGTWWFGFGKTRRNFNMNAALKGRVDNLIKQEMANRQAQQQQSSKKAADPSEVDQDDSVY